MQQALDPNRKASLNHTEKKAGSYFKLPVKTEYGGVSSAEDKVS
jgi:hypothetical protein